MNMLLNTNKTYYKKKKFNNIKNNSLINVIFLFTMFTIVILIF